MTELEARHYSPSRRADSFLSLTPTCTVRMEESRKRQSPTASQTERRRAPPRPSGPKKNLDVNNESRPARRRRWGRLCPHASGLRLVGLAPTSPEPPRGCVWTVPAEAPAAGQHRAGRAVRAPSQAPWPGFPVCRPKPQAPRGRHTLAQRGGPCRSYWPTETRGQSTITFR